MGCGVREHNAVFRGDEVFRRGKGSGGQDAQRFVGAKWFPRGFHRQENLRTLVRSPSHGIKTNYYKIAAGGGGGGDVGFG